MKITEQEVVEDITKMFDTGRFEFPVTDMISTYYGGNNTTEIRISLMQDSIDLSTLVRFTNYYLDKKLKEIEKAKEVGEITLTSTEDGELVAVTRQDEEGRILKVIWSKK